MSAQVPPEVLDKYNYLQHTATEGPEQAASRQARQRYTYPSNVSLEDSWTRTHPRAVWAIAAAVIGLAVVVGLAIRVARDRQASRRTFPESLVHRLQQALKQALDRLPGSVKDRLPPTLKHAFS